MDEDILSAAETYAKRTNRLVSGRIGFGIHGTVFTLEGNAQIAPTVLKVHYSKEPFTREWDIYLRLADAQVTNIDEFDVPQLLTADRDLLAIEMTMVKPPFVLDFAGAYLDFPPEF